MRKIVLTTLLLIFIIQANSAQDKIINLTDDGTWCWFSDPRAIKIDNNKIVTGYIMSNGSVAAMQYNMDTGEKKTSILNEKLEVDDHNNPAFLRRKDGYILAFYTKHHNNDLYMNVSVNPDDASEWRNAVTINPNGSDDLEKFGDNKYTYANPFMLSKENDRIFLFGRWIGFKPNMTWSDDGGKTWAESRVVFAQQPYTWSERPYVKYFSNGKDKIHMVFTDGHPRDEVTNSIYYTYYSKGAFFRMDGEMICTVDQLPFQPKDATVVYDANKTGHRAWIFDIVADRDGNPAIAYARYPTENEHIYHYAWYDGEEWFDKELANSGRWFPQTPEGTKEREPHYSGGMAISPCNEGVIYLSVQRGQIFEIEKWTLDKTGMILEKKSITTGSGNNQVRPFVLKDNKDKVDILLWNSVKKYIHYTDFLTEVRLLIED